jgi:predicted membrane protein
MSEVDERTLRALRRVVEDYFKPDGGPVHFIRYDYYADLVPTGHSISNPQDWIVFFGSQQDGYVVPAFEFERYKARMALALITAIAALVAALGIVMWFQLFGTEVTSIFAMIFLLLVVVFGTWIATAKLLTSSLLREFAQAYYVIEVPAALTDFLAGIGKKIAKRQQLLAAIGSGTGMIGGQIVGALTNIVGEKLAEKTVEFIVDKSSERHIERHRADVIDKATQAGVGAVPNADEGSRER